MLVSALIALSGCGEVATSVGGGAPGSRDQRAASDAGGATNSPDADKATSKGGADGAVSAPSCQGLASTCGPDRDEACCASPLVTGGTFLRNYDGVTYLDSQHPATVSDFLLDKYDVTVGRFRKFVAAYSQNMIPAGAGKNPNNATDPGWDPAWNTRLPVDAAALAASEGCIFQQTWTDVAAGYENRPMTCTTWFEAFAFCIWDGGRLPTDLEWDYAAAGGSEQRAFPWSNPPKSTVIDCTYANYKGASGGTAFCLSPSPGFGSTNDVGSESPKGDGRWGQADLAGNVIQWTLDWYTRAPPQTPCVDCADTVPAGSRILRGGGYMNASAVLFSSATNDSAAPEDRTGVVGFRCARNQ